MRKKYIICIAIAIMLSGIIFKINQKEYIPEYNFGEKAMEAVNSFMSENLENKNSGDTALSGDKINTLKNTYENNLKASEKSENIDNDGVAKEEVNGDEKGSKKNVNGSEKANEQYVRVVIMNNSYTTIYYNNVELNAKNMNIYHGNKFKNKKSKKNNITLDKNSKYFKNSNVVKVESKNDIFLKKDGNEKVRYKGIFFIYKEKSGLVVVNQVALEDYVAGVISSEIGESAPIEAMKAQAICARTFITRANENKYKKYKANGDDSTNYQVYNRILPTKKSYDAANDTKGLVMKYKGQLVNAYYFSTSWGYTTNYKIWSGKKQKYLKGTNLSNINEDVTQENIFRKYIMKKTKALEEEYPFFRWHTYLSEEQIKNSVYKNTDINVGEVTKVEINKRGKGGIVSSLTIYGSLNQISIVNQNQIRKILNSYYAKIILNDGSVRTKMNMLPSAFIAIDNEFKNNKFIGIKIYGGGFGHGSGMSQNGACQMAKEGYDFEKILKKFYSGINIEKK